MRILFFLLILLMAPIAAAQKVPLHLLKLPPGFKVSIYAEIPDARSMTLGPQRIVFVGTLKGQVYAVVPDLKKPFGTQVLTIASGLNMPNGVTFYKGALYVAEIDRILRYEDIVNHLAYPPKPKVVTTNLPNDTHHGWRFIDFGPDGKLYVAIGMPCNTCLRKDSRFGTIMRMDVDGGNMEVYVKGIRNSIGFDWDPTTNKLWFTDNGRDWMGDNLPPDKLNYAPRKDLDFGFPYYDGKNLPNRGFGTFPTYTLPTFELPAHVAALGIAFYTGNMFPQEYRRQIFIAEHGSWNRSKKVGYQIRLAKVANNQIASAKSFMTGWLQGQKVWGRPVDALVMPDGALLVSDDYAGVIYRIYYSKQ